jgi:hypothetical protein
VSRRVCVQFVLIAFALCGCATSRPAFIPFAAPKTQPAMRIVTDRGTIAIAWSEDIAPGLDAWAREVELMLGPSIILEGHGGYRDGKWIRVGDDPSLWCEWEIVADLVRRLHPDKPIVILSCNERGAVLTTARVFYPRDIAWSRPNLIDVKYGVSWLRDFAYTGATSRPTQ